ncbi:MAG: hypothetical protein K5829_05285 [Treponema sp.]|nr:hypothetical protein [Treponema sp.]
MSWTGGPAKERQNLQQPTKRFPLEGRRFLFNKESTGFDANVREHKRQ